MSAASILILGNPNSGKSLLFNRLTGLSHKVANFPGVTVEVKSGRFGALTMHDFPGIYSLEPLTKDEAVAVESFREALGSRATRGILYVMDATRLERSLYLLLQLRREAESHGCPVVVALNIMDEIVNKGARVDIEGLSRELGLEVFGISARTNFGLDKLKERLASLPPRDEHDAPTPKKLPEGAACPVHETRGIARRIAETYGPQTDILLKSQNRIDAFLLNSVWGAIAFLAIMLFLFQAIFSWAAPAMDFISDTISVVGEWVAGQVSSPVLSDFLTGAVFEGIGSFLVFAPQIFILFVIIGVLEDSGYLARTTIMFHRPLSLFGLTGRSFVPLLSGHACAIPAILATRTIESPRRRLATMIAIPFMACSARIPVYAVLIAGFVPAVHILGNALTLQGVAFFGLYALGIVFGLLAAAFVSSLTKRSTALREAPFVVELPPYRWPSPAPILKVSLDRTLDFIKKAGGVIFVITVLIWFLGYFPHGAGHLDTSYLGRMGHAIEGFFTPMGMDWKIGVAVLTSFLAREVFVGTLGTLYGLENADENIDTLSTTLSQHTGMTLASAAALLVFYALSMQCVSTLAVIKKESDKPWMPAAIFIGMTIVAYAGAVLTYQLFR